jgi:SlyX protein
LQLFDAQQTDKRSAKSARTQKMTYKNEETEALQVRLTEMEIKFAYAQETIESLNGEVTKQWSAIDKLKRQLNMMHDQMENYAADAGKPQDEPPPPHY